MVRFPKHRPTILTVVLAALLLVVLGACTSPSNTFDPKSDVTDSILTLYVLVTVVASIVGFAVLVGMAWLLWRFRAKEGVPARQIHGNTKLEIAWTIAPIFVLLLIGIPTMFWIASSADVPESTADNITEVGIPGKGLEVIAIGHQWWFEFRYPGLGPDGADLVTANELHIPDGVDITVTLLSDDVVHSFWVPQLVGKTDMLPGRENMLHTFKAIEVGTYVGQCAEFCGAAHALMQFRVQVETLGDFTEWVGAHNAGPDAPEVGTAAFRGSLLVGACAQCHTIQGTGLAGEVGPDLSLFGERSTLGAGILDNTDENLRQWIGDVRSIKPVTDAAVNPARYMPQYLESGLLDEGQIGDLAAYLRSLTK
jgi:cytochrome c oxidase subunit 2